MEVSQRLRDSQTCGLARDFADAKLVILLCASRARLSQRLRDSSGGGAVAERSEAKWSNATADSPTRAAERESPKLSDCIKNQKNV